MKRGIIFFVFLAVFLAGCTGAKPENLSVDAVLKLNENENMDDKDYMLEIYLNKELGNVMVYPLMQNLDHLSFDENESDIFYCPGSLTVDFYKDKEYIANALKTHNFDNVYDFSSLMAFQLPDEKEEYKLRVYFEGEVKETDKFYIIFLHKEKFNTWTKLIEIDTDIANAF